MKNVYLIGMAVLSLLLSCKKDKTENNSHHISCKIDGVESTFNSLAMAVKADESLHVLIVNGRAQGPESDGIVVMLTVDDGEVKANTYLDTGTGYEVLASYYDAATSTSYEAGTEINLEAVSLNKTIKNQMRVVVTSIDAKAVRGTFSGDFFEEYNIEGQKKTITEGSFYLPIVSYN